MVAVIIEDLAQLKWKTLLPLQHIMLCHIVGVNGMEAEETLTRSLKMFM